MQVRKIVRPMEGLPTDNMTMGVMLSMECTDISGFIVHLIDRAGDNLEIYYTLQEDAGGLTPMPALEGETIVDLDLSAPDKSTKIVKSATMLKVKTPNEGATLLSISGVLVRPSYDINQLSGGDMSCLPEGFLSTFSGLFRQAARMELVGILSMSDVLGGTKINWIVQMLPSQDPEHVWPDTTYGVTMAGLQCVNTRALQSSGGFLITRYTGATDWLT